MLETVTTAELKRYALITWSDVIMWDADDITECLDTALLFGGLKNFKGIYDYVENVYIDETALENSLIVKSILGGKNQ